MRPEEYEAMYRVEDTHWWYRALRGHVLDALTREARRLGFRSYQAAAPTTASPTLCHGSGGSSHHSPHRPSRGAPQPFFASSFSIATSHSAIRARQRELGWIFAKKAGSSPKNASKESSTTVCSGVGSPRTRRSQLPLPASACIFW